MIDEISTVNQQEVDKFSKLANSWWDPKGPLWTLHEVNPLRVKFVLDLIGQSDIKSSTNSLNTPPPSIPAS